MLTNLKSLPILMIEVFFILLPIIISQHCSCYFDSLIAAHYANNITFSAFCFNKFCQSFQQLAKVGLVLRCNKIESC